VKRREAAEVAGIVSVWCATIAAVDPRGEFPLHDDWMYAISTWDFARTGHFHFPVFTVVSLRAQVLWGALWTRLFGESFEVLRASTLFLSLATLIVVHRILARAGAAPWLRVAAPLVLLVNPIFLWASCTYMTDVPFLFVSAFGFYWFARGVEEDRFGFVIAGCVAAIVSWFIRQNGVVNLLPPLALLAWQRPRRWRAFAVPIVASGLFFVALWFFKRDWLTGSTQMFVVHYHMWLESSFRLFEAVSVLLHYVGFNAIDCALCFLPLALSLVLLRSRSKPMLAALAFIALLLAIRTTYLGMNGYLIPYSAKNLFSDILPGPVVFDFGVGPVNTIDIWAGMPYAFVMPHVARIVLTIGIAILATLLIWSMLFVRGNAYAKLAVASVVFGTLILFGSGLFFDRYSLDAAWAIAVALPLIAPMRKRIVIPALIVVALFSTFAVREHFAWQRARYAAFRDLRANGVAVDQIDGGAEINGYYELANATLSTARKGHPQRPYVIAFNVMPGYRVAKRYPFSGYLGLHNADVLVLRATTTP